MAAILKLRRGTSFTSLQESELFYNTSLETIVIGDGSGSNTSSKILVKLNESNSGSLHLLGDITGSNIYVSGDITASNLSLSGDADFVGNITLGGDIFLGDGTNATDNINVNASFSGSLIPTTTSVFSLGTNTKKYLDLRVVNATIDNINLPGSTILSSSVTDFTDYSQSVDNRLDLEEAKSVTLETVTSSLDTRLDVEEAKSTTLTALTASYDNRLSNLQITSASHDGRLDVEEAKSTTLSALTASYDNRLSNLQITSASHDGRLDVEEAKSTTLETVTSSLDVRLDVEEAKSTILETVTSSLDNRISQLETDTGSQDGRLDNLELISASHDGRLDVEEAKSVTLETVTASLDTRLDVEEAKSVTLETVSSSLDTRLDNVESYTSSFASDTVTLTNKTINGANNTLTVDISRDTNLAVSDTTEVNMILTDDTISAELIGGVVSGSSQIDYSALSGINANIISASSDTSQVDMIINGGSISANLKGGVVSGSTQIDYSGLSGINNDIVSASTDSGRVNFTITDGNISADLIGGVVTGSTQININHLDTSDLSEHSSNLYYTDARVKTKLNTETVISGSSQVSLGGDVTGTADDVNVGSVQGVALTSGEATQISNIGSTTISSTQWGYLGVSNQGIATTNNVIFNDADFTGDVQVNGSLTVLGSATEISTTELRIEDKLITVASGSVDSAAADGAGIEIDGANKSIQWDHNTTSFVLNAKVSSSVGFKGEGGELTGIDTDQVTEGSNLYYTDTRVKTKLDADTVVSGSSQINISHLDTDGLSEGSSNLYFTDARVKTKLNTEGVISGSVQIDIHNTTGYVANEHIDHSSITIGSGKGLSGGGNITTTRSLSLDSGSTHFTEGIKKKLDIETVFSGSSQVNADTITNFDSNVKAKLDTETVVSGSSQVLADQTTGWVGDVRTQIDNVGLVSSSAQINANSITNFDSNVKDKLTTDGVHSGSFLGTSTTTNLTEGTELYYTDTRVKTKLDAETVISGSSQVTYSSITGIPTTITGGQASAIIANTSKVGYTDALVKAKLNTETVVSGSASSVKTFLSISESDISDLTHYTDSNVKAKLDADTVISGSTFSSPSQGTVRATINGANTDVDTGLQTGDSPTFTTLTLSSVASGGSSDYDALFNVGGLFKKRTLGTAAFLNVSASIADDPNSIPTTKAVNDALIAAGAGDITSVNSTATVSPSTTGIVHTEAGTSDAGAYGNTGATVIAIDTGSAHFQAGVELYLDGTYSNSDNTTHLNSLGVVSGSSQLYSDLDSRYNNELGEGVVSSSAQLANSTVSNESLNSYSASAITATAIQDSRLGFLSTETGSISTAQGVQNQRLSAIETDSGSYLKTVDISSNTNLAVSDTTEVNMILTGDTISAELIGGVVSGSSQVVSSLSNQDVDLGTGDITATTGSFDVIDLDRLSLTSTQTTVSPLHLTATNLQDGVGALRIDGSQADIYLNPTASTHTTVTFAVDGSPKLAFGMDNSDDFYITRNDGTWHNDTLTISRATGEITLGYDLTVNGNINATNGIISGSSQVQIDSVTGFSAVSTSLDDRLDTLEGDVHENVLTFSDTSTIDLNRSTNTITANVIGGIFSGSSQIAAGGDLSGNINDLNVGSVQGVALTSGEVTQIAAIGTNTISATQWGYLGASNQGITTTSDVTFASASLSNVVISGNLTVLGDSVAINVSDLKIEDKLITVASGSTDSATADGAGIEIAGANESITWNHANTRFNISDDIHVTGTIKATDDIIAFSSSDRELKNNILPITNPLEKINKIGGYYFDWNEEKQDIYKGNDIGVIAQEIEEILPELVQTRENGYKAVKYDKLVSLLIEGIKELSNEVEELKRKIES